MLEDLEKSVVQSFKENAYFFSQYGLNSEKLEDSVQKSLVYLYKMSQSAGKFREFLAVNFDEDTVESVLYGQLGE